MIFEEYGPQKSLYEILEELATYCAQNGVPNPKICVKLPKAVLDQFSIVAKSKERIKLFGEEEQKTTVIKNVHVWSGVVELEAYE